MREVSIHMTENGSRDFFDATEEFQKYRMILRTIWNSYLWENPSMRDWDLVDHFDEARPVLFEHLILEKIRRELSAIPASPISVLIVPALTSQDFTLGAPIRISETLHRQVSREWSQAPGYIRKTDMVLRFKDFFDWNQCDYRDLQYFLVEISHSERYPELIGREALMEVNNSAVLAFSGEPTRDELSAYLDNFRPGA